MVFKHRSGAALTVVSTEAQKSAVKPPASRLLRQPLNARAIWAIGALFYLALATLVSSRYPKTSDQAGYFLAGIAVAHGHLRLGGWMLTPPDFYTSDIALSALLSTLWRLIGRPESSPLLLIIQPALTWTALVTSTLLIAHRRGATPTGLCLIAALLGVPLLAMPPGYFPTLSAIHLGSVLYILWALHHAARSLQPIPGKHALTATFALLTLGIAGDPLVIVAGTLPILATCLRTTATPLRPRLTLAATAIAATLTARLLLALNTATGGFTIDILPVNFAPFTELGTNAAVTLHDLIVTFGADPTGLPVTHALPELARLALLLLCLHAAWQALKPASPPFGSLLASAALLDALALLLSDRITLEGGSIATVRYLFPLWIALTTLGALQTRTVKLTPLLAPTALVLSLVSTATTLPGHSSGILSTEDNTLITTLHQHDLHHGIGSWWTSLGFQIASHGDITVVPALTGGSCGLTPFVHINRKFDLSSITTHRFFILVPHPDETYTKATALKCFPAPEETLHSGRYEILIYTPRPPAHPLTP